MIDYSLLPQVLLKIRPNAVWVIRGTEIEWLDENQTQPTDEELIQGQVDLINEKNATAYREQRAREYPPISDYMDALVKGDEAQMQAYIDACLAVKAKYPKPE